MAKTLGLLFGMKQRFGIASAMLGFPKLLILDEPTNGLDPSGIQEMRELIRSLPERCGMTVIISSHILSEIDRIVDDIGIIANGELRYQGELERLHEIDEGKTLEEILPRYDRKGSEPVTALLKAEYLKNRRRYIFLTALALTAAAGAWAFYGSYTGESGSFALENGYMLYLYQPPLINTIFFLLMCTLIASRLAETEHSGGGFRRLCVIAEREECMTRSSFTDYSGAAVAVLLRSRSRLRADRGLYKAAAGEAISHPPALHPLYRRRRCMFFSIPCPCSSKIRPCRCASAP